jgi:hypothetical protein
LLEGDKESRVKGDDEGSELSVTKTLGEELGELEDPVES